jgi:hypothetical protein
LPELPRPAQLLVGPFIVNLSLGTTATSAKVYSQFVCLILMHCMNPTYNRWSRSDAGSHRSDHSQR